MTLYRDEKSDLQCDCGAFPWAMRIYFKGEEREARICNECYPETMSTEYVLVGRRLEETSVYRMAISGATQWSYMSGAVLEAMGIRSGEEPKDPWPQRTWLQNRFNRAMDSQARLWKRLFGREKAA